MSDLSLNIRISSLSARLKSELSDYLDYLVIKKQNNGRQTKNHPKAGCMKGSFVIHPDFDEPLDDFKENME